MQLTASAGGIDINASTSVTIDTKTTTITGTNFTLGQNDSYDVAKISGGTVTEFNGASTHAIISSLHVTPTTITNDATATVTDAATVYIPNAPNATGAKNASLLVAAGKTELRGLFATNVSGNIATLENNGTPSVATGNLWQTNSGSLTITDFLNGITGQTITVLSKGAITFDVTGTNLNGGTTDIVTADGDITVWTSSDGTNWYLNSFMDQSKNVASSGGANNLNELSDVSYSSGDLAITDLDTITASGPLTLDVGGNITLDANGGTIEFKDNGVSLGEITNTGYSGNAVNVTGTVAIANGGTGATSAPMIGVVTANNAAAARTVLSVDPAGTDNSTNVTLGNTDYLSITDQEITGGVVPIGSGGTGATTAADARTALGAQAALTFGISNTNVIKCGTGIVDNDFLRISGTTLEGRSASEVLSDIGAQAALTFGISNTNVIKCGTGIVDNDFLRISGTTLEGRSASEVLSDIGAVTSLNGLSDVLIESNSLYIGNDPSSTTDTAQFNVAIGTTALDAITTGDGNTVIGYDGGTALTTGANNVIIGSDAGKLTEGVSNTIIIGTSAGAQNMTSDADASVLIGFQAGTAIISGQKNTAIGYAALSTNTVGDFNTAIGYESLLLNEPPGATDISGNTAIGCYSGKNVTEGLHSTFIGYNTASNGSNPLTGLGNTAVGSDSGKKLEGSAEYNTLIGYTSGIELSTGSNNVIIGYNAGSTAEVLSNSVIIGNSAGASQMDSDANGTVAIGVEAANLLTTGQKNTAVGAYSLEAENDGDYNTAIGYESLQSQNASSGDVGNTAVGCYAGKKVSTGIMSTFIGFNTGGGGGTNISGINNTAVGALAGYALAGAAADNTVIGYASGQNITTGTDNTCLGKEAGETISTGSNNIVIGSDADVSANNNNNEIVIGFNTTGKGSNTATIGNSDVTAIYMASDSGATVHCGSVVTYDGTTTHSTGAGISGSADTFEISTIKLGNEYVTTIFIALSGLSVKENVSSSVIGTSGQDSHIMRIDHEKHGEIYKIEVICVEQPQILSGAAFAQDISIIASGSTSYGTASMSSTGLADTGGIAWSPIIGTFVTSSYNIGNGIAIFGPPNTDLDDKYVYLIRANSGGFADQSHTYTNGKFIIKMYGAPTGFLPGV